MDSAGRALPGIEIRLVDPETGRDATEGDVGEVWTRSDQNCAGYWGRPEANTELFAGEWLRTGDLGRHSDGYLYITDRSKDLIVSARENVYASEVEAELVRLAGVSDACVVGIPHRRWGGTVAAAVVAQRGHRLDESALIAACRTELAHYKCPTSVRVVDELPPNATGKVLRRVVRETLCLTPTTAGAAVTSAHVDVPPDIGRVG